MIGLKGVLPEHGRWYWLRCTGPDGPVVFMACWEQGWWTGFFLHDDADTVWDVDWSSVPPRMHKWDILDICPVADPVWNEEGTR